MDTSQWIGFFRKAGLPANVAANYAIIFFDNRIQVDMLLDLTKEYLYDMGIKVMGDVIAILKFAKEFHNQLAKERIIGVPTAAPMAKAVAERMVGHYTRSSPVRPPISQAGLQNRSTVISLKRNSNLESPTRKARRVPPEEEGAYKIKMPLGTTERTRKIGFQKRSTVISLKRELNLESPARKARRVPPEEEGAYKIKMPLGTTERTRKILQMQQKAAQGAKRSVFSRLGDSAVSSSTDSKVSSSVFERLGPSSKGACDDTPSSTVLSDFERPKAKGPPLPYRGVLKMTVGKDRVVTTTSPKKGNISSRTVIKPTGFGRPNIVKTVKLNQINTILRTNKSPNATLLKTGKQVRTQGIFGHTVASQGLNVKSRLGGNVDARNLSRTKIMLKNRIPAKSQSNVFDRLGR